MIHGMMLVRNEASRDLETKHGIFTKVLESMKLLCDRLVVIDDKSTDGTVDYVSNYTSEVYTSPERLWDKNEVKQRELLWKLTLNEANHGDWIVCLDADELIDNPRELKYMLNSLGSNVDGLGFRLFDMWSMTQYRADVLWNAHNCPWPMAIRYNASKDYVWHEKALHCGRFPANASQSMLPTMIPIRHYGWALEEDRKKKYDRYMRIDGEGKHGILAQYESILDENPNLVKFKGV